jgi:hypothetical protein
MVLASHYELDEVGLSWAEWEVMMGIEDGGLVYVLQATRVCWEWGLDRPRRAGDS